MRALLSVLAVQVLLGITFAVLVATGNIPGIGTSDAHPAPAAPAVQQHGGFDGRAAFRWLELQVSYGPRPAGSVAERRLAERLRHALPHAHFEAVPGGLRNVVATVPGRERGRYVVVGAHYDTRPIAGFLGADNGAAGTAAVLQMARQLRPHAIGPTVVFILFDGEEAPAGTPDSRFLERALRGSKVAAHAYSHASAMILLDLVAGSHLQLPRESSSDQRLWARLRAAAQRAGVAAYFPPTTEQLVYDDHTPFERRGVRSVDLIDWNFPCIRSDCDNLSAVSEQSLYASGEAVWALLPTL